MSKARLLLWGIWYVATLLVFVGYHFGIFGQRQFGWVRVGVLAFWTLLSLAAFSRRK